MSPKINIAVSIDTPLYNEAQLLAQQLNISQDDLVALALEHFMKTQQAETSIQGSRSPINQGDIYWVENLPGMESAIPHPQVVIQDNVLNQSRIHTVVVCGLTTNLSRANAPGNILLEAGEANLPKQSIIEVSKVSSIDKTRLGAYIGTLSEQRIQQIIAGMRFLQRSSFIR